MQYREFRGQLAAVEVEIRNRGVRCMPDRLEALQDAGFHEVGCLGVRYSHEHVIEFLRKQSSIALISLDCALLSSQADASSAIGPRLDHRLLVSLWQQVVGM
jgi:hypothetical protein